MPILTVEKTVNTLTEAYCSVIKKGMSPKVLPSVMLWGPPGVGKSQGIRQIAKQIEKDTKKKVVVTDVRLLLFNPIDLRGIPTANEDKTLAIWLKPQIFQMDESDDVVNLLFLDEISSAPQSVQAKSSRLSAGIPSS
jgi:replication-associated recombination protein RarA